MRCGSMQVMHMHACIETCMYEYLFILKLMCTYTIQMPVLFYVDNIELNVASDNYVLCDLALPATTATATNARFYIFLNNIISYLLLFV